MEGERKIEILAPFDQAIDWTKQVLFRPFQLEKWLVIGFAAFLAHLAFPGGGNNFNRGAYKHHGMSWSWTSHPWQILLIVALALLVLVISLTLMWIRSRGQFIFVDCVVRNRAAIKAPWREYKREGNSLFLFTLAAVLILVMVIALAALPLAVPMIVHRAHFDFGATALLSLAFLISVTLIAVLCYAIVANFMVVAMYRQRIKAFAAFRAVLSLLGSEPTAFILYLLFCIMLVIGASVVAFCALCATCCIAAIPYVGTVIMLPLFVFSAAYSLFFLRQFGPEWDAWSGAAPAAQIEPEAPTAAAPLPTAAPPPLRPDSDFAPPPAKEQ